MRILDKTPLENYVEHYLKQNNRSHYKNLNFLRKARMYIQQELNELEYPNYNPIVDLETLRDNMFTKTVFYMIRNIDPSRHRKSLERTVANIDKYITQCCII